MSELLPWHRVQWTRFNQMLDQGRMHHAWLLGGSRGLGKQRFALRAARALLCESTGEAAARPCGECRSCALTDAGSHPDLILISPEEDRRIIGVDQVRGRLAELALTAHYAGRRVALVSPADALNRHAADSLLKTLEEPGAPVTFLLVTSRPASLPVTVRSRCITLAFTAAAAEDARHWLSEQGVPAEQAEALLRWCAFAPLAALEAYRDGLIEQLTQFADEIAGLLEGRLGAIQAAQSWRKTGLDAVLDWQLRIVTDLMQHAAGAASASADLATKRIPRRLDLPALNRLCEELLEYRAASDRQLNPNEQLALEHLAATWAAGAQS